jgi:hypothetical protein
MLRGALALEASTLETAEEGKTAFKPTTTCSHGVGPLRWRAVSTGGVRRGRPNAAHLDVAMDDEN